MRAADIMTNSVITVAPKDSVQQVARLLLDHRISGVPVVDESGFMVGIVTESDLMRRSETETDERRSWWLRAWTSREQLAYEYVRTHALKIADVMTRKVITASPDTALRDIASLLEQKRIKRIPVVNESKLVGIISRADLLRAFINVEAMAPMTVTATDEEIRNRIYTRLNAQRWAALDALNVAVDHGVVEIWASVNSEVERKALRVAAETTPGVIAVKDHVTVGILPSGY